MPTRNTSLHERALKRALAHESVDLTWGEFAFSATKNPLARDAERTDENNGDSTACTLHAVVSAEEGYLHANQLPVQGSTFTDASGRSYRVASIDYTPGLPSIVFHIPNVVTLS